MFQPAGKVIDLRPANIQVVSQESAPKALPAYYREGPVEAGIRQSHTFVGSMDDQFVFFQSFDHFCG
jgi:hypothetical protein